MIDVINSIGLLLGGSWASGINLYLTIAALGLADRWDWITLPEGLAVLTEPVVIVVAVALFAVEALADKIPLVDSTWDSIHTFIRPFGGAALGFLTMTDASVGVQLAAALVTGTIALDAHLTKATTRAALNASPEPFSNILASVTEDISVIGILVLVWHHPWIAAGLVVAFLIFSIWFLRKMFRWLRGVVRIPRRRASAA